MDAGAHEVSTGAKRSRCEAHFENDAENIAANQVGPTPSPKRPRCDTGNYSSESGGVFSSSGVSETAFPAEAPSSCTSAEAFVVANSEVAKTALQDDPSASWLLAFPPSFTADAAAWERTLSHLAVLERLHAEEPAEWMRILQVRTRPLYASIANCSAEDLAELLHLVDYLQLPKQLAAWLTMYIEVLRLGKRLRSVFTGDEMVFLLESSATLKPLVAAAKKRLEMALADVDYFSMSSVYDGACGFLCDPFLDEADRPIVDEDDEDAVNEAADKVGSYVAGQLLVGATRIKDLPRVLCRVSGAPGAVAAYRGDIAQLNALKERGWCMREAVVVAFATDRVPVLEWWDEHGCTSDAEDTDDIDRLNLEAEHRGQRLAAARGHVDVLRWMDDNDVSGDALLPGLDALAVRHGRLGVLKFLCEEVDD